MSVPSLSVSSGETPVNIASAGTAPWESSGPRKDSAESETAKQEWARQQAGKVLRVQLESSADYGLALLRTPEYRQRVIDFYTEETADEAIALYIIEGAQANDIPLSLAFALAWMESRYNPEAVNHNSSSVDRGLFQLNSRSFPSVSVEDFFDPSLNSRLGLEYLRQCLNAGDTEIVALAMYNAGRTRVSQGGTPLMTLEYISRILEYKAGLEERFYARCFKESAVRTALKEKAQPRLVLDTRKGIK